LKEAKFILMGDALRQVLLHNKISGGRLEVAARQSRERRVFSYYLIGIVAVSEIEKTG
jgi:hypothetical protein